MIETETIKIEVRAEGPGPDLNIRLRRALKWLLRSHGLRCVSVSDVRPVEELAGNPDAGLCQCGARAVCHE